MSTTPKGYIYAELDVTNPEYFYGEYMPRVGPVLEEYGAKFLVAGGDPQVIEGDRVVKRIVLLEFESLPRAKEFFFSPAYQDVIGYRLRSADTHLYFMEGTAG